MSSYSRWCWQSIDLSPQQEPGYNNLIRLDVFYKYSRNVQLMYMGHEQSSLRILKNKNSNTAKILPSGREESDTIRPSWRIRRTCAPGTLVRHLTCVWRHASVARSGCWDLKVGLRWQGQANHVKCNVKLSKINFWVLLTNATRYLSYNQGRYRKFKVDIVNLKDRFVIEFCFAPLKTKCSFFLAWVNYA